MTDDSEDLGDFDSYQEKDDVREQLLEARPDTANLVQGGLAFDLVTRQLLFVRRQVAAELSSYYEAEGFDLFNYKMHPYLPVDIDDRVFECVFLSDAKAETLADWGSAKTYDFPEGRLAVVPVMEAWAAQEGEDG